MPDPVIVQPSVENPVIRPEDAVENPVIRPEDAQSSDLLKMAQEADEKLRAEESGRAPAEPTKPASVAAPEPAKIDDKPVTGPARDEQGRFTKADGTKSEPNEAAPSTVTPPAKPLTEYQKAEIRQKQKWQKIEDDRQQLEREKTEWQAQKDREAAERAKPAQPQPDKYSSEQLFKAADGFAADARAHKAAGNHEEAADSAELADKARMAGQEALKEENQTATQRHQEDFTKVWQGNASAFIKEVPEAGDPKSELSQKLVALFNEEPMLNFHPEGLRKGYELLQLREKGSRVDQLQSKVTELEAEVARLRGATELGGAPPAPQTHSKTFDDLPLKEQSAQLGRMAEEADRAA